jgi:hypothetical protein
MGHDVHSVVATPELASLPDDEILAHATASGRALVTANIKDFLALAARDRLAGRSHAAAEGEVIFLRRPT